MLQLFIKTHNTKNTTTNYFKKAVVLSYIRFPYFVKKLHNEDKITIKNTNNI